MTDWVQGEPTPIMRIVSEEKKKEEDREKG
jgi:hypothetical protein